MKKFQEIGETMTYLPEEVVREILLRLPVKSLLRFRSVCKSWLSLISDPLFAESHFELASDRFLYLTASQTRSIDVDASFHDDSAVATHNLPITAPSDRILILGSCRGFVLLEDSYNRNLFVWNPSTSWYKKLPYYPTPYELYPYVGFGYDSSKEDYLIVITSYDESADNFGTRIDFFSLKNNSWRNVEGTHPYTSHMDYHCRGVFLNGAIHWLTYLFGSGDGVIVAFDLIQKNIKELPLPDDYRWDLELHTCEVLGGCFSMFMVEELRTEIWIMKEYGVKSSWSKSIMVSIEEFPINLFSPVCITKSGEIVGIYNDGGLMKRKHDGELLEHRTYGIQECNAAIMYKESLLSFTS